LGIILYLFIGGVISAVFAKSITEAIAFAAGWTGFLGVFGLKQDFDERKTSRDEELNNDLQERSKVIERLTQQIDQVIRERDEANEESKELQKQVQDAYDIGYSDASTDCRESLDDVVESIKEKSRRETEEVAKTTYYDGYYNAIEDVAKADGTTSDDVLKKLGK